MQEPLISVIICVRDGEAFLGEALESVARQGIGGLDVVIIDDGSADRSAEIASAHPLKPRVISQGKLGLSAAFSRGMHEARGQFLAPIDCDDVWPDGRLSLMLAAMQNTPRADFLYGRIVNTDEALNPIAAPLPGRLPGAMLFKRETALEVGELRTDISHGAFVDWCSRAALRGCAFHAIDAVVLLRRIHGDNMGIRERPQARSDMLKVLRDHLKRTRP